MIVFIVYVECKEGYLYLERWEVWGAGEAPQVNEIESVIPLALGKIVAKAYGEGDKLNINICWRTGLIANAREDLQGLGKGNLPTYSGSKLWKSRPLYFLAFMNKFARIKGTPIIAKYMYFVLSFFSSTPCS